MGKKIYENIVQGEEAWHSLRCGRLTASEIFNIVTPAQKKVVTGKGFNTYAMIKAAERIKGVQEETYTSFAMEQGHINEPIVCDLYNDNFNKIKNVGFVENDSFGFKFGCSPDGLLINSVNGKNGGIEIKSKSPQLHLDTIVNGVIDPKYILQMQGVMLACDLDFIDFLSYSEGLLFKPIRVTRSKTDINTIIEAGKKLEELISDIVEKYKSIDGGIITKIHEVI